MRRTDLLDTRPEAHRTYVRMLRGMTPEERFARVLELIELTRSARAAGDKWKEKHRRQSETS